MKKRWMFLFLIMFLWIKTQNILAVEISIENSPESVCLEDEFEVGFNICDISYPLSTYSYKVRIGSTSTSLNQGQTYNSLTFNWLDDTSSWINFPTITLNPSGIATSSVKVRTKLTAPIGDSLLVIRANKDGKNYDSNPISFLIIKPSSTPTPILIVLPTVTPSPFPTLTITPTIFLTITPVIFYDNIFISEAMVNPLTGEKEWIEIFNNNDFSVFLQNWFIDDIENAGSAPKMFSLQIPAYGFGVFEISSSIFNNDGDSVRLLDFEKNLKDSFEYGFSVQEKTWGREDLEKDSFCLQEQSKGEINNKCLSDLNPAGESITEPVIVEEKELTPTPTAAIDKALFSWQNITPAFSLIKTEDENNLVLGASTELKEIKPSKKPLIGSLSLASFFYSLLTISSVFFKIKNVN